MHRYHGKGDCNSPYNNPRNPVNPDSKPHNHRKYYIESCRGKDAKHRVSTNNLPNQNKDVLSNPENPVNPDSNTLFTANITLNPVGEKMMRASSLRGG